MAPESTVLAKIAMDVGEIKGDVKGIHRRIDALPCNVCTDDVSQDTTGLDAWGIHAKGSVAVLALVAALLFVVVGLVGLGSMGVIKFDFTSEPKDEPPQIGLRVGP